ncbi:hypothetical protein [Nocardioides sp. LML1-1-1.1]|uniref:hypothetical protein n=1 Tax=Nocardioides sp. LML1-1-1.1 TaxID=3135248 RepID=UPI00342C76D6
MAEKKEPGTPAPVSRLRGGPGTFGGCSYQVQVAIHRLLDWVQIHSLDPSATGDFRCEPRVFPNIENQFGFDYGLTGSASEAADGYFEAKANPTQAEVEDIVASLRRLPVGEKPVEVMLTSAVDTPWFNALHTLQALSREATNDSELSERVAVIVNDAERARVKTLLDAAGDTPWTHLQLLGAPLLSTESNVEQMAFWKARTLAGSQAGAERLLDLLARKVMDGFTTRASFSLSGIVEELRAEGLLGACTVTGPPDDAELANIAVVLQICPVPLPKGLLAQAMGVTVAVLDSKVARMLEDGILYEEADCLGRPDVGSDTPKMSISYGADLARSVLEALNAWAARLGDGAFWQTLNATALARAYADTHPEAVAPTFKAFDKATKRWGDLGAVMQLARASNEALATLLKRPTATAELAHELGAVRAQTLICGHSWVLQRVGQYENAIAVMALAETISIENHDPENEAFALKCEGRLRRMQSETLADSDPERAAHLRRSVELLVEAFPKFEKLLETNPRFAEDVGECVSLLARTYATSGDLVTAAEEAARANSLLSTRKESKAYADLKVLDADLFLFEHGDEGDADLRDAHLTVLSALLDRHIDGLDAITNARSSEVVARLHATLARLVEPANADDAVAHFEAAAHIYDCLGYVPDQERNMLNARRARGERIPPGLEAALNAVNAPAGARLRALDEARRLSTPMPGSMKTDDEATDLPVGDPYWDSIVSEAVATHSAATTHWTDGLTA